jgi:DNA-binding LacI/PurR family transcriptional regulator
MANTAPNINDLASRLSLSKGTVSRILNDPTAPFAAHTRTRVLSMAEELGYRPNPVARALAMGRTGSVALWIRNLRTSYRARVAQSFESQVEANDYRLVIRLYGRDAEGSTQASSSQIMPESADGIVTHGAPPLSWTRLIGSGASRIPIVSTGTLADPETPDYVGIDLSVAAREAVELLIRPGRRRVAYLAPHDFEDERSRAYTHIMAEAGLAPEMLLNAGEARSSVRRFLREYIVSHGHPEAIFCMNDDTAIAAYRALIDLGLRVPEDVALVGCDGIEDTEYMPTPISTIAMPLDEMSRLAWQFLKTRLQDPDAPPQRIILPSTLIRRESSPE